MGNKISLEDEMINLKITSKQMVRASKKCEKNEKSNIEKLKKPSRRVTWRVPAYTVKMPYAKKTNHLTFCSYPLE